jgi:hypothetical protein
MLPALVVAQTPYNTILPGAQVEYRFTYRGDGTPIKVAFDGADVQSAAVLIYTPQQVDAMARGEKPEPIGRGTPSKEHNLFWSGSFKIGGIYRVVIENRSIWAIQYRLDISGEGVSAVAKIEAPPTAAKFGVVVEGAQSVLNVTVPMTSGETTLRLVMPPKPAACTPAKQIPPTINQSIKLCPGEIYPPLRMVGSNIALFADDARSAVVTSSGRQFAVTLEGSNNWVEGIVIQARADPQDLGAWLCLYDECIVPTQPAPTTLRGGLRYGGGILLRGSQTTIHGVTVRGGTIGVATVDGKSNYVIENQLSDLNGWGSFNVNSVGSYFVANTLDRNNHACTTPDGRKFAHGCETAGWVCLACSHNVIARNRCDSSANCFYMSGERGLGSNDNHLVANVCMGATDNCFEITFSRDNVLQDNYTTFSEKTGAPCRYPYWIGGSVVYFKNNAWQCEISPQEAFEQARDSTTVGTNIINLETFIAFPTVSASTYSPLVRTPTPPPAPRFVPRISVNGEPVEY